MRLAPATQYREDRDAISHDWLRFLARHDITPVLVPNNVSVASKLVSEMQPRRILLTGGDNVGAKDGQTVLVRDQVETVLLDYALESGARVLGTCRGLQFINVYFGGEVTEDLKSAVIDETHVGERHRIVLAANGRSEIVNSFHDQGVLEHQVARDLAVFARSDKGVVEGLRHGSLPILAVQWHPEREGSASRLDEELMSEWKGDVA